MPKISLARAAFLAAALALAASSTAFAGGFDAARAPRAFNSFVPGATEQWCDSLPYPYCRDPAPGTPGSGPAPFAHAAPPRPVFGE